MHHNRTAFVRDNIEMTSQRGISFFSRAFLGSLWCDVRRTTRVSPREPRRRPSRNRLSREMEAAAVTTRRRQSASLVASRGGVEGREERSRARRAKRASEVRRGEARNEVNLQCGRKGWMCKGTEGRQRVRQGGRERRERNTRARGRATGRRRRERCTSCAPGSVEKYVEGEHPQCTRCTHTPDEFTNFGRLSRSLHPLPFVRPARRGKPVASPSVTQRGVLSLSPSVSCPSVSLVPFTLLHSLLTNSHPSFLPAVPPRILPPAHVCLYRTLWYTYVRIHASLVTRVTRESLSRIRAESPSSLRRAP